MVECKLDGQKKAGRLRRVLENWKIGGSKRRGSDQAR